VVVVFTCALFFPCLALKPVTLKQLDVLVSKSEFVVVTFHSTITEQIKELSKRVVEEIDRVTSALNQDNRVRFVGVSLDQHPEAMNEFGLSDIPSIVIFRDKYPRVYYGQRTGYTMFSFFQDLLTVDPVKIIVNKQEKKQFSSDDHSVRVVGYFTKEGESLEAFKMAARHFQGEITFGLVQDPKLAKTWKLKSEGDISIVKPGERAINNPNIFTTRDGLVEWIQENKKPLWGILTFQNIYSVWQGIKTTFVVFLKNMDEHYSKTVLSVFKTLAKQYGPSHDIAFVVVDAGVYKEFVQGVGLTDEDLPTFAIFHPSKRKEYFFPKDKLQMNINNAKRWLDSFLAGKLESIQDKPFYSEQDAVVQVDAENFKEIVLDESKDVLLEFYAPWCGHCASLAPHYKSVALHFKLFPSIILGAFDAQASAVPEQYNVTGLPSLLFFPSTNKENPVLFSGYARDRSGLVQFILEHQTTLDEQSVQNFQQLFGKLDGKDTAPNEKDEVVIEEVVQEVLEQNNEEQQSE